MFKSLSYFPSSSPRILAVFIVLWACQLVLGTSVVASQLELFPQLLYAQDSSKSPANGTALKGALAEQLKKLTKKKYIFEIEAKKRKPLSIPSGKQMQVRLSKDLVMDIKNVDAAHFQVTIINKKTRKVLKKQKCQTNDKINIILGAKSETRMVIVLTKGSKRPG